MERLAESLHTRWTYSTQYRDSQLGVGQIYIDAGIYPDTLRYTGAKHGGESGRMDKSLSLSLSLVNFNQMIT